MSHLFMGLDPRWIIREPYIPVVNTPAILKAQTLGIQVNPCARALIFPNIGSYFGGDVIAGILFSEIHKNEKTAILVDVGSGEFNIHTIDDQLPRGICGSGVIDLAAQLFLSGMLDIRGKLVPNVCGSRLKEIDTISHLVVVPADQSATQADLTISQADLDSLIRSKAAMYTILRTITASVGVKLEDLETFYVAGTFGSFINPVSAISIGMLPDLPLERYKPLGNSSLGGAGLALTSGNCLEAIDRIRDRITYLELNVNPEFMNRFSAAKFLPHTDPTRFPSVRVWKLDNPMQH